MTKQAKILIIDDLEENIFALKSILESLDVKIYDATNSKDALELVDNNDFALILLDVKIPKIDGYDIAKLIKNKENAVLTPIIFLTAHSSDEENILKGYQLGAVDYIFKPINTDILLSKVQVFLDLYNMKQELKQVSKIKSEFLHNMSHEFRTPLNAIIGNTEILIHSELHNHQIEKLNTIFYAGETLLQIVNDIFSFSSMQYNKLKIEEKEFNLYELCSNIACLLATKSYNKRVELILDYEKDTPKNIISDPKIIKQIIYNIANNAVKFTEKGYIKITVVHKEISDSELKFTISIEDTGIGIPKEQQKNIFNVFTKIDTSTKSKFSGIGLGLSNAKAMLEKMGGSIELISQVDKGSKFTINLNVKKSDKAKEEVIDKDSLKGLKILIIDDSKAICEYLQHYLSLFDVDVDYVESGKDALRKLGNALSENKPYHLALVDYIMSDVDGIDFGKMIKSSPTLNDTILILMTAYARKGLELELESEGFSGYLHKPINKEHLYKILQLTWKNLNKTVNIIKDTLVENKELYESKEDNKNNKFADTTILLVEDNRTNQLLYNEFLSDFGSNVIVAEDGIKAIEKAKENKLDLILMDCQMPNMDGFDATVEIKKLMINREIELKPIIALTATTNKSSREKCFECGMNDFIAKPVRQEELKKILAKWLF